jgi:hypothetical protein
MRWPLIASFGALAVTFGRGAASDAVGDAAGSATRATATAQTPCLEIPFTSRRFHR